jgi:ATP-dependent helicase/nuclease subunit A
MGSADAVVNLQGMTEQQYRAVTARGVSVALSAGAGCGKTFVLTKRFLAELEPDGETTRPRLSQLVAITFTERAAREMRDRIRKACRARLMECPANQADYWLAVLRDLDAARISTIHSFCGTLLRSHAVEIGIDPRFRVLDAAQSSTLLFELTDEVLRAKLAERDEPTIALVTRFGLTRLREMIARWQGESEQIDWKQWREETPEGLVARWESYWRRDTVPRVLQQISNSVAAKTLLDVSMRCPPVPPKMRERCDLLLEKLPLLSSSKDAANDLTVLREAARVQGGATKKNWGNEEAFERFKDAAKELRDAIDKVVERMRFDAVAARPAAEMALQALALAGDLTAAYDRKKREVAVLDFNDLLMYARSLLVGSERAAVRKRLASQIRLLLVDEFQDTDPMQVEMVKAICDNEHLHGKLFFVGDHKQSIYRFRGARPEVFRDLQEEIPPDGRLPLSRNFRSQPGVLDFVNALFCEELAPNYEPLLPQRPQVSPLPSVEFLWANTNPVGEDETAAATPEVEEMGRRERLVRQEAEWIARRLRTMLDMGETIVWDADAAKEGTPKPRSVREGDIAILFRALTNVEYYEEALQRYDIKYYLVGGHAFYAQQEIFDLLNLLRAINSSCDEVSLAGALRSPMFGLNDETLLWLAKDEGLATGFFDAELPFELSDAQRERVVFARTTLRGLRAMKDRVPVAPLISQAIERTGYDALLLAEFLGERKLANLQKLVEQARSFDRAGIFSLSDFITQLSEFVARQPDEALAATHPETANVVKLMSIHQSKGLEFPVVVVPDMGRRRNHVGPVVAFTPELGPMFKDPEATTGYDLFVMAENEADLAETSRLLYVAATRAADYLILSSPMEELGKATGPWLELIGRRFDLLTGEEKGRGEEPEGGTPPLLVKVTTRRPVIASQPVDHRQRRNLLEVIEKSRKMAEQGQGLQPRYLAAVPYDQGARRQYSFSRLTGQLHARAFGGENSPVDSDVSAASPLDARGLGTLVHAVMAKVDFSKPDGVHALARSLAEEHLFPQNDRFEDVVEMIERFVASPRAAALASAAQVHREVEFLLAWPPCYLQGFMDCLYCDAEGEWRLIDYKTNQNVTPKTIAAKAADYKLQMYVYALAMERILKRTPAELVLCFLRPGLEYQFEWNDEARESAAEILRQALPH